MSYNNPRRLALGYNQADPARVANNLAFAAAHPAAATSVLDGYALLQFNKRKTNSDVAFLASMHYPHYIYKGVDIGYMARGGSPGQWLGWQTNGNVGARGSPQTPPVPPYPVQINQ